MQKAIDGLEPNILNDWEVDTRWAVNQRRPRRSTFISNLSYLVGSFNKMKEFINSLIVTNWTEVATIDDFNLKARDDDTQWWMQEINSRKTNSTWAVERRDGDLGKKVNLTLSLSNTFHCENVYLKYNLEHNLGLNLNQDRGPYNNTQYSLHSTV